MCGSPARSSTRCCILHDQTEESSQGQAGHHRSRLQADSGILYHFETWCRLRSAEAEDGYYPSGVSGSLTKKPCNREASASSMVPGCRNASSTNTEPVAAKSYTRGQRSRVGVSAAHNCGQADRRNWGHHLERTIPLDMGGLLPQEEWMIQKTVT